MKKQKCIASIPVDMCPNLGYDAEKILKAVNECIAAMGELTIKESVLAREHLNRVMEKMYKRDPDTLICTIQPHL